MQIADLLLHNDDSSGDFSLAGKVKRRQRRIAFNSRYSGCFWPRSVITRCFRWIKKSKRKRLIVAGSRKLQRTTKREDVVDSGLIGGSSSADVSEDVPKKGRFSIQEMNLTGLSGRYKVEASFNLAVGFGLVYITTIIKNELNKIIELRTQMETLMQNVKETVQNQSRETIVDSQNGIENSGDSDNISSFGNSCNNNTTRQEKCPEDMNQLEAELEVELERLQIQLDAESNSNCQEERRTEMANEGTAPELSLSARTGEVIMDHIESRSRSNGQDGVLAKELEIKLQELLEARQEERIKELQENLEQTKLMLIGKEKEVSWLKDTALVYPGTH